ncbi:uncharacterized protein LOC119662663 [Teleopsis dalmanni]|uniref:uncharacterized protein LOC119662663 n=1 Tax=Teleopsis dalmanni TaxID=139649 RepID=UPI000D32C9CB|nr:uncharacterized protein LOC119662663 [Teleopsis dalmanni]
MSTGSNEVKQIEECISDHDDEHPPHSKVLNIVELSTEQKLIKLREELLEIRDDLNSGLDGFAELKKYICQDMPEAENRENKSLLTQAEISVNSSNMTLDKEFDCQKCSGWLTNIKCEKIKLPFKHTYDKNDEKVKNSISKNLPSSEKLDKSTMCGGSTFDTRTHIEDIDIGKKLSEVSVDDNEMFKMIDTCNHDIEKELSEWTMDDNELFKPKTRSDELFEEECRLAANKLNALAGNLLSEQKCHYKFKNVITRTTDICCNPRTPKTSFLIPETEELVDLDYPNTSTEAASCHLNDTEYERYSTNLHSKYQPNISSQSLSELSYNKNRDNVKSKTKHHAASKHMKGKSVPNFVGLKKKDKSASQFVKLKKTGGSVPHFKKHYSSSSSSSSVSHILEENKTSKSVSRFVDDVRNNIFETAFKKLLKENDIYEDIDMDAEYVSVCHHKRNIIKISPAGRHESHSLSSPSLLKKYILKSSHTTAKYSYRSIRIRSNKRGPISEKHLYIDANDEALRIDDFLIRKI